MTPLDNGVADVEVTPQDVGRVVEGFVGGDVLWCDVA